MTIDKGDKYPAGGAGGSPAGAGEGTAPRRPASPIEFRLDATSGVPTYLQLVQQVEHALRLGYLKPGDQLPKVRDVVASLAINPNTVLKAYRDLEREGLVRPRPGLGTFVVRGLPRTDPAAQTRFRKSMAAWLSDVAAPLLDRISNKCKPWPRETGKARSSNSTRRSVSGAVTTSTAAKSSTGGIR
jgi:GntR family transcriptional regulator